MSPVEPKVIGTTRLAEAIFVGGLIASLHAERGVGAFSLSLGADLIIIGLGWIFVGFGSGATPDGSNGPSLAPGG